MPKIYKAGKVAVVLSGRYAGKKVVVIRSSDEGTKERPYAHAIVAGIDRYPKKVTKGMGAKKVAKRSKCKPFIKAINYNHLMPTRYAVELEGLKNVVSGETFKDDDSRQTAKKEVKKIFEQRFQEGKNSSLKCPSALKTGVCAFPAVHRARSACRALSLPTNMQD